MRSSRLIALIASALFSMGILGAPSCQITALIIDPPSYNWLQKRIESATPPYQTDSSSIVDVPVYVYGTAPQYSFKVGSDSSTDCTNAQGYAAWTSTSQRLQADISGIPDGLTKLCLIGRSKKNALSYNTQPYSKATIYKWMKDTAGPGPFSIDAIESPTNDNTPTLSWSAATGAALYDVKLSDSPDCTPPFQSFNDLTSTSLTASTIPDGSFHICVTARSSSGLTTEASNNGLQVVIDTVPPGDFQILRPTGTVFGLSQTAEWTAASGATQYHLMLTSDSGCTNMISEWNSITATTADITVPSEGDYHLCAEAIDAANNKKLSPAMAFSVAGAPQEVVIEDRIGEPSSTNGREGLVSTIVHGLGGSVLSTISKIHVDQDVRLSKVIGIGVPLDAIGPASLNDIDRWIISIHSTEVGALTAPLQGDVLNQTQLPRPEGIEIGQDVRGFPTYQVTFDLTVQDAPNILLQANRDYWYTIMAHTPKEWQWMESARPGDSDVWVVDGAFIWAWDSAPGYTTGRSAVNLYGQIQDSN
ncbi:MAG: hypothetical protein J5J00_08115 [Deltaproteobacteria bacterium]|nr:hypothetical protein [Deltaproteobacteria bacterium]